MKKKWKESKSNLIHKKLATIIHRQSKDPRFLSITISRVESAKDTSFAKVYYSMYPPHQVEEVTQALNQASGFFSMQLAKTLKTRNTPKLFFVYDAGFDYSIEIDQALEELEEER